MNNFAQRWLFSTNHKCDAMHAIIAGSNRAGTTGAKPRATQPKVCRRVMSCVGVDGLVGLGKRILMMRPPFLWSVGGFMLTAYECRRFHPNILLCGDQGASLRTGTKRSYCGDATSSPDALGRTNQSARFGHDGGEGGAGSRPRMSCKPHANGGRDSDSTENRSGDEPPAVTDHMDGGGWRRKLETLERNEKSGKVRNIYSICTDPNFLILAYEQIKYRTGNIIPEGESREREKNLFLRRVAPTPESLDRRWFERIAELLRSEQFRFKPAARRIPTPTNPKELRPLTIGSDEIVQQAMKIIMEHIYEPKFLDTSHGFRPGRGCHSGLEQICLKWKGASWFLEFGIKRCFDSIDQHKLVFILQKHIEDQRWMDLVHKLFTAGLVGVGTDPVQGSVLSRWSTAPWVLTPLLCNVYLHELDQEVAKMANELSRSRCNGRVSEGSTTTTRRTPTTKAFRAVTPPQSEIMTVHRKAGWESPTDWKDSRYARAFYLRYAGNFLLGIAGPKELVITVKSRIVQFVNSKLHLELAEGNISHISAESAKFLGMEIKVLPSWKLLGRFGKAMEKRRRVRNRISTLRVQKHKRQDSFIHDALVRALGKLSRKHNSAGLTKLLPKSPEMAELAKALLKEMQADKNLITDIRDSEKNFQLALSSRLEFAPDEAREVMDKLERILDKWCNESKVRPPLNKEREEARRVERYEALSLQIFAPLRKIRKKLKSRGLITENNKSRCVVRLIQLNDKDIVLWFNSVARDLLSYYRCCANFYKVRDYVDYFLRWSLIHTMARKHKASAAELIAALSRDIVIKDDEGKKTISFLTSNEIRRMGRMFLRGIQCGSDMRTLDGISTTFGRSSQLRCFVEAESEDKV